MSERSVERMGTPEEEAHWAATAWCNCPMARRAKCKRKPGHEQGPDVVIWGKVIPASLHISATEWRDLCEHQKRHLLCADASPECSLGVKTFDHVNGRGLGMTPSACMVFGPLPRQGTRAVRLPDGRPYYYHTVEEGASELMACEPVCQYHDDLRGRGPNSRNTYNITWWENL